MILFGKFGVTLANIHLIRNEGVLNFIQRIIQIRKFVQFTFTYLLFSKRELLYLTSLNLYSVLFR